MPRVCNPIAKHYDSLAFDKEHVADPGKTDLVAVGHPLLDAAVEEVLAKHKDVLDRGAVLVDNANRTIGPRLMLAYALSLVDGGGQELKRLLYYVEVEKDRPPVTFGQAPYIDYRKPTVEESAYLESGDMGPLVLPDDAEGQTERMLMEGPVASDVRHETDERAARIDRVTEAVKQRLNHAISDASREEQRWQVKVLRGDEGAVPTAANKRRELEDLKRRRDLRLRELEAQRTVRPKPLQLVAAALVIPSRTLGKGGEKARDAFEARKISEKRGMDAVMTIERSLHHEPTDVSRDNKGWDIQSKVERPDGTEDWLFIESKGVCEDADTVTLSANEVMKAANNPKTFVLAVTRPRGSGTSTTYFHGAVSGNDINPALDSYPFKLKALEEKAVATEAYEIEGTECTRRS